MSTGSDEWYEVTDIGCLGPGGRATAFAGGVPVVVFNVGDELFALEDECPHEAYPLSDGELNATSVVCALHGARFSLRTGAVLEPPASQPVATWPVRVVGGKVQVRVRRSG